MAYLSIPNWAELQHYKDRNPPWIKLHNELLENYDFECLPDASKAHLLCIMLLASRTNNKMNPDSKWIGRKIGANSKVDIDILIKSGFVQLNQPLQNVEQDASTTLQDLKDDAGTEKSREEERESREEERKAEACNAKKVSEVFKYWQETLNHKRSKLGDDKKKVILAALKTGYSVDDLKQAIMGCSKTPHNMGENDRGEKYDQLTLILKNSGQIDRFIGNSASPPTGSNGQKSFNNSNGQQTRGPTEDEWNSKDW